MLTIMGNYSLQLTEGNKLIFSEKLSLDLIISIADLAKEAAASVSTLVSGKKQNLHLQIPKLPPVVAIDEFLRYILISLLLNAHQYTPPNGQIILKAEKINEFVKVEVIDTGIGINHQDKERIFKEFFRSSSPLVQEHKGLGLSLALSKYYVEYCDGQIGVESQLGKGSKFWFILPT